MEPVKFEEHVKKQLSQREITPSADSWSRLESRLENNKSRQKPYLWWIGMAAAVLVIALVIGSVFSSSPIDETPVVVETPSEGIKVEENSGTTTPQDAIVEAPQVMEEQTEAIVESIPQEEKKPEVPKRAKTEDVLVAQNTSKEEVVVEPEVKTEFTSNTVVAEVADEGEKNTKVTDSEVEALLQMARTEIQNDPAYAAQQFDSEELLDEVEFELEESFREKVFEVLKKGFSKAKTAVANRNY
ncbi:hypothetical protein [Salinimicrobium soli]|uniref:hypothetical protein n=1 Tax=Salinimicrobium soli TaxID=1254399 RepID=UPI003AAF942E